MDSIGDGKVHWKTVVENFYPDLDEAVQAAEKNLEKVEIADEETDVVCEECGRNMVIKYGPHGRFLACPGFPECRNTKPYLEKIGVACPLCGKDIVIRKTKKGRRYYGCEGNPECEFMSWQKPVAKKCPQCGGYRSRRATASSVQIRHVAMSAQRKKMSSVVINKNAISICDFQRCGDRIFVWQHMD